MFLMHMHGYPFEYTSEELVNIGNKRIMDIGSIKCLDNIKNIGQHQYDTFLNKRIFSKEKNISE